MNKPGEFNRDLLKSYIEAAELTQSAMARAMGCSQSTVNRWFNTNYRPDPNSISKLAKTTGIPETEWLSFTCDWDPRDTARLKASAAAFESFRKVLSKKK